MGLNVPSRIHIMPVGYEFSRVVDPAQEYKADHVELISHTGNDQKGEACYNLVKEELDNIGISYTENKCDIFDFHDSLGTISEIISNYPEDSIFVNVSSGSKITAIAGTIGSMALGGTAYYAKAGEYDATVEGLEFGVPNNIERVTQLPHYPIDRPEREQVVILKFIQKMENEGQPPTKGQVINFSDRAGLPFVRRNVAGKGKYRLLDNEIVDPLSQRGFIEVVEDGRSKLLTLTEDGSSAIEAYQWLVDDETDWEEAIAKYQEENDSE